VKLILNVVAVTKGTFYISQGEKKRYKIKKITRCLFWHQGDYEVMVMTCAERQIAGLFNIDKVLIALMRYSDSTRTFRMAPPPLSFPRCTMYNVINGTVSIKLLYCNCIYHHTIQSFSLLSYEVIDCYNQNNTVENYCVHK
jgi:hypothetical protein